MITKRIIPCLDVRDGRVVKGTNFEGLRDMADPVEMARFYNESGADELVFYDITASFEERALFTDILKEVASKIFIPLTVGGGINSLDDFDRVLKMSNTKIEGMLKANNVSEKVGGLYLAIFKESFPQNLNSDIMLLNKKRNEFVHYKSPIVLLDDFDERCMKDNEIEKAAHASLPTIDSLSKSSSLLS